MAEQARKFIWNKSGQAVGMRALWRLAIWGGAAAMSLVLVVVASRTDTGATRIATAMASPGGKDTPTTQVVTRSPQAEAEAKRLADAVRTLTADRDRLAARVGTLERNLEDMTGSIRRQAGTTATPPSAPPPAPIREAAVTPAGTPAESRPASISTATEPPPAQAKVEPSAPAAAPGSDGGSEVAKTEFGVDVGGAVNQDGLRALWTSTKGKHANLFEGLHPVFVTRENSRTKAKELRLILGPVETVEAAHQLCATLSAARRYCQPVGFEGQKLADAERKPPQPKSAAPAPAAGLPWPFR